MSSLLFGSLTGVLVVLKDLLKLLDLRVDVSLNTGRVQSSITEILSLTCTPSSFLLGASSVLLGQLHPQAVETFLASPPLVPK